MKNLIKTTGLREAVIDALQSVEFAKQKCILAGQMLLDEKTRIGHGDFEQHVTKLIPEVSIQTVRTWMRAASSVAKALPPMTIDIQSEVSVSTILSSPDKDLTKDQLKYKQAWFDFTADKTIKECLNSVMVYGDDSHRVDRAINGKTKGGKGGDKVSDRKEFERFTATKLGHITTFLTVQKKMAGTGKKKIVGPRPLSPVQQAQISAAFINFLETAPNWLLITLHDKITTESKLSEPQRYSR